MGEAWDETVKGSVYDDERVQRWQKGGTSLQSLWEV